MDYTNRQIGDYRVIQRVAQGGYSDILRAHPLADKHSRVAIKILKKSAAGKREIVALLEREWKIVRSLEHPRVIRYHEFGWFRNLPYIIMDWFDGQTVRALLAEKNKGLTRHLQEIFAAICEALTYIHAQGIVHRDIKPENILVEPESGEARLIDFSNAHTRLQRWLSFGSKVDGTLTYMSPEQVAGKRCGPQSDIYSLGAVLFEIIAGRAPFVGKDAAEIRNMHLKSPPPRASRFNREISSALDKLIANMLAKVPAARPQSAALVLRRFQSLEIYAQG